MLNDLDSFYLQQKEPYKSCLLALRDIILLFDNNIKSEWKYQLPFFCINKKMICYLWIHKKLKQPYIGFADGYKINHPDLIFEKRSRIKIILIDPNEDIPIESIHAILGKALKLYQ